MKKVRLGLRRIMKKIPEEGLDIAKVSRKSPNKGEEE